MKKLAITINNVREGLYRRIGKRKISRFLEGRARPHVVEADLDAAYRQMAADEVREAEAAVWSEGLIHDVANQPRS